MLANQANERRTHGKTIFIVMRARLVVVIVNAELRSVSECQKILNVEIRDSYVLLTLAEDGVQLTVRFLLKHWEIDKIPLEPVRAEVAE